MVGVAPEYVRPNPAAHLAAVLIDKQDLGDAVLIQIGEVHADGSEALQFRSQVAGIPGCASPVDIRRNVVGDAVIGIGENKVRE